MIKFTVKVAPVSKKNSQQIFRPNGMNRPMIVPSKKYKDYEEAAMWYIPHKGLKIDYPCNVKCVFYMPTRRKVDKTNLEEAIHDIMVKAGLLADDNRDIIAGSDGTRVYYDKKNPRTEIEITPMEDYEQWGK